tara:strand:+ start:1858 stop:2103 length:246 start_codon:yes stop_codon:yes gene_type:complete
MPDGMITARVFIEPYPLKNIVGVPFQGTNRACAKIAGNMLRRASWAGIPQKEICFLFSSLRSVRPLEGNSYSHHTRYTDRS